jgi:phosphoglucosamine mutase
VDCAKGADYRVSPKVLWELGAEVITIGADPDGFNINDKCGSTAPQRMCEKVREMRADIGIALDGDADRVVIADEKGRLVDGDQLLGLIATYLLEKGQLAGGGVVATVMSNLGLERYLESFGLKLERTRVGDRYVMERMREGGYNVGGEQSGHIILTDHTTTGDGLIAALQVLAVVVTKGRRVSEICHVFDPVPQLLENVRYSGPSPLEDPVVADAIARAESMLGNSGRLVIRPSGTEPVIRVMAEGDDEELVRRAVGEITEALQARAA